MEPTLVDRRTGVLEGTRVVKGYGARKEPRLTYLLGFCAGEFTAVSEGLQMDS